MSNPNFLICQFRPGDRGPYCEQPIGQMPSFGRVYLDRMNEVSIVVGVKYLCQVVHSTPSRSHFVTVVMSVPEVLKPFLAGLSVADWKRGAHATDDIKAEVRHLARRAEASWYQFTGRYARKFLTLKFDHEGEKLQVTMDESDAREELALIERRIRKCVGPAVDMSAVIARQKDSRRSSTWR